MISEYVRKKNVSLFLTKYNNIYDSLEFTYVQYFNIVMQFIHVKYPRATCMALLKLVIGNKLIIHS